MLDWEEDTELRYKPCGIFRILSLILVYALILIGIVTVFLDAAYLSKNRDELITVEEFAENYNGYAKEAGSMNVILRGPVMQQDGEWEPLSMIEKGYIREHPLYLCDENGYIRRIEWTGRFMYDSEVCQWIAQAVIGAQPNITLADMVLFQTRNVFDNQVNQLIREGKTEGVCQIENVQLSWTYESESDKLWFAVSILNENPG